MNEVSIYQSDQRYSLQAQWTKQFRDFIISKYPEDKSFTVLEVGCGTGAVMRKIKEENKNRQIYLYGVDISRQALNYAKHKSNDVYIGGNGEQLPFENNSFDLVYCHFLLLWTKNPEKILQEMHRVLRENGYCAVMAEPDYTEMQAKPEILWNLADKQRKIIEESGADIAVGQKLGLFLEKAGFTNIETAQYRNIQKSPTFLSQEIEQMLLDTKSEKFDIDHNIVYYYNVPTYYAYGRKGSFNL